MRQGGEKMKISTKDMALVPMFTSLTAMGAFISIPVGPVPITLQSLFVILSGLILGPRLGALSQILYIILGLMGIPIFSAFTGGLQSILRPSFGFIIGFVFASYIVGKITYKKKIPSNKHIWIGALAGSMTIYLFGLPYMYYILNIILGQDLSFLQITKMGCLLFLPGDFIKLGISSLVGIKTLPILQALGFRSNLYNMKNH